MPVIFEIIEPNDIMAFVNENSKADNDTTNKIRELIIANIFTISPDYLLDPTFGTYWTDIRKKLQDALHPLSPIPYHSISIEQKGGMKFNYDFVVHYCDTDNRVIHSVKLEFKNNTSHVKDLAQFLELYDRDCKTVYQMFDYSYAEFYYDHFLDSYLAIDTDTDTDTIVKPDKQTYLQNIGDIKYKHPFIRQLYERKTNNKKQKDQLVEESRAQFLSTYATQFNFDKIEQKIRESLTNKHFLLWDKDNFHIQLLDVEKIAIVGVKPDSIHKLYFDIIVDNFAYNIRVRLNWGNNNGIANPRWKLTFIDK